MNLSFGKQVGSLIAVATLCVSLQAQSTDHTHEHRGICGNEADKMAEEIPGFWDAYVKFADDFRAYQASRPAGQEKSGQKRIIPVVVHVLHQGGNENISRAQILDQLVKGNLDFNFLNPDRLTIPPQFDSVAGNPNIEFRLATRDPQGNCTDGINRIYTPKSDDARDQTDFKRLSVWDRSKYLNIWVVNTISNFTPFGTVLGYAQFPFTFNDVVPATSTDGIVLIHNRTGTMGTASGTVGRTFTHEIGHWLGLRHIWGDSDCGNDMVDDTPFHREPNFGCFSFPKEATCYNLTENSTAEDTIRRFVIGEMFNNYMDYTNDNCMSMFSAGQVEVMDFVLEDISFRRTLWQEENIVNTGTRDDDLTSPCAAPPKADLWSRTGSNFYLTRKLICEGSSLVFRDGSFGGAATDRTWNLPGANNTSPDGVSPNVSYATPGVYDASITVSNAAGTNARTRTNYVQVSSNEADDSNWIYFDSFEWGSLWEQGKWTIINEGREGNGWGLSPVGGGLKSFKSMRMRNESGLPRERFYLISPSYDLSTIDNPELEIFYAYGPRSNNPFIIERQTDQVRFYVSTNCGETWNLRPFVRTGTAQTRTILEGSELNSAGLFPSGFVPTSDDQFRSVRINMAPQTNNTNVRVMVEFTSGGPFGNDFYIDNLTIRNRTTSIEESADAMDVRLYPNPARESARMAFTLAEPANVAINVMDITGRRVYSQTYGQMESGSQEITLPLSQIGATGIYIVQLQAGAQSVSRRLMVD